ncbi:hypothetical protein GCK72_015790 [Caenorhabditis remanei]|uniref:Uncharacterized protein n=1 Tax=Caenorhabditis remanei TaxID=31234 RepID=A0A6A5GXR6_CAERE|nr:hypothetical protein GCK72_015790 [Caenorhabditis remanei]KAF1759325.1 hypothetical protein GCK72_015790 [Caenorhabditis remanei]
MSEQLEIPIEGGDFDFDGDNIQELDHFDIGEEEDEPAEVPAGEAGVWEEAVGTLPLSRQRRKSVRKKPGRKRRGEVYHIPKRQLPRGTNVTSSSSGNSRIKTYQQYDTFDEIVDPNDMIIVEEGAESHLEQENVMDDSDPEIMDDDGEPSSSKTWRVFVRKDGSGMHFDWPIFMDSSISLKDVVTLISTDASEISKTLICDSIPQEFTNTGTFIIHLEEDLLKEEICDDGLGTWNSAQMFVRKYIIGGGAGRPLQTNKNDHNLKIVCEQFLHPGTDTRGDFIRRIYTGFDKDEHMIPYVVICYEWMGQPHPLTVYEDSDDKQTYAEQMTWKKCSNPDDQVPILSRHGCDYNAAVQILLSAEKFTNYGKSVPQLVQECISFVLDVEECGGARALYMDGNTWERPSGSHRFYRIVFPTNRHETTNTFSIERAHGEANVRNSDIQVICRRYNGRKYTSTFGFVRKTFQLKILPTCPPEVSAQLVNQHLAVVSYSYRNAAMPTFIEQPAVREKLPNGELIGEEVEVVSGEIVFDDPEIGVEMHQMLERIETKKKANSQRLMDLIERMQRLDDICKKTGWHDHSTAEVQQLLQLGAILESTLHQ